MNQEDKALLEFLLPMVNEKRTDLLLKNMEERTRYLTVVLEDIYQSQNASAVLRTCDCLGIQDVHVIENRNEYTLNPEVELGAAQWLSLQKYSRQENNTREAILSLKKQGYRIVATTPHTDDVVLEDFDVTKGKCAILLGTEMHGLSHEAMDLADEFLRIPMVGFTESFNISVSAAIILYHLNMKIRNLNLDIGLSAGEKEELMLQWVKNSVNNIRIIEPEFRKRFKC